MKSSNNKHDVEEFTYDLKPREKIIRISDKQILEDFNKLFSSKIESQ